MERLVYEVSRWPYLTAMESSDHAYKFKAPAARDTFLQMVYDMIAAQGLLDRPAGHAAMDKARACEITPPARGYGKSWRVELGPAWVELTATRRYLGYRNTFKR